MRHALPMAASVFVAMVSAAALADDKSDCLNNGDHDLRIKGCSTLIEREPKHAVAYHNRGVAYQAKGDLDRAIADYNKAIELKPNYARAYDSRGKAYASKGVYTNAVADVTKASELTRKKAPAPQAGTPAPPAVKAAAKPTRATKSGVEKQATDNTWPSWVTYDKSEF
jgi:tetratricopeptide (TPR) repeat protein